MMTSFYASCTSEDYVSLQRERVTLVYFEQRPDGYSTIYSVGRRER